MDGIPLIGGLSVARIIGCGIFSTIGFVAFMYGKKIRATRTMITGVAMMAYPYFFTSTFFIYLAGVILTAVLYFWRD